MNCSDYAKLLEAKRDSSLCGDFAPDEYDALAAAIELLRAGEPKDPAANRELPPIDVHVDGPSPAEVQAVVAYAIGDVTKVAHDLNTQLHETQTKLADKDKQITGLEALLCDAQAEIERWKHLCDVRSNTATATKLANLRTAAELAYRVLKGSAEVRRDLKAAIEASK